MVNFLKTKSAEEIRAFILDKTSSLAKIKVVLCFVKEKRAFSKLIKIRFKRDLLPIICGEFEKLLIHSSLYFEVKRAQKFKNSIYRLSSLYLFF